MMHAKAPLALLVTRIAWQVKAVWLSVSLSLSVHDLVVL